MATTTPCGRAITAVPTASGEIRRAAGGQTPCSRVAPSTTSASGSTCRCASSRPMHTPHAFARSMLTAAPRPSVAGHCAGASWSPKTWHSSTPRAPDARTFRAGVGGGASSSHERSRVAAAPCVLRAVCAVRRGAVGCFLYCPHVVPPTCCACHVSNDVYAMFFSVRFGVSTYSYGPCASALSRSGARAPPTPGAPRSALALCGNRYIDLGPV